MPDRITLTQFVDDFLTGVHPTSERPKPNGPSEASQDTNTSDDRVCEKGDCPSQSSRDAQTAQSASLRADRWKFSPDSVFSAEDEHRCMGDTADERTNGDLSDRIVDDDMSTGSSPGDNNDTPASTGIGGAVTTDQSVFDETSESQTADTGYGNLNPPTQQPTVAESAERSTLSHTTGDTKP